VSADVTIAVAIPAFEAGATVAQVVRRARPLVQHVLVVDDGSPDATAAAAERLCPDFRGKVLA